MTRKLIVLLSFVLFILAAPSPATAQYGSIPRILPIDEFTFYSPTLPYTLGWYDQLVRTETVFISSSPIPPQQLAPFFITLPLDRSVGPSEASIESNQGMELTVKVAYRTTKPETYLKCVTWPGRTTYLIYPADLGPWPNVVEIVSTPGAYGKAVITCNLSPGAVAGEMKVYEIGIRWVGATPTPKVIDLPPAKNSCPNLEIRNASTINIDSFSLGEKIPLVGVPFSLNYESDRFRSSSYFNPKVLGLGGWVPSNVHHYSSEKSILYMGAGTRRTVTSAFLNGQKYVASEDGTELYFFDQSGNHIATKDALTGLITASFNYDSQGRLTAISDRFTNTTRIEYQSAGATLTSPYGQRTFLTFDSNGFLAQIKNPNAETHRLTHSVKGLLVSFTKPKGQTSQFTYDADGFLLRDSGAGEASIDLSRTFNAGLLDQTVRTTTSLGRQTVYRTTVTGVERVNFVQHSDGSTQTSKRLDQDSFQNTDRHGGQSTSKMAEDPRFRWMAPFQPETVYSVPGSEIKITQKVTKSATLEDSTNPFSHTVLRQSNEMQGDLTRVFSSIYTAGDRKLASISPLGRVSTVTLDENGQPSIVQSGDLTPVALTYDTHGRLVKSVQSTRLSEFTYDSYGNLASHTDSLGRTTRFAYDGANRLIRKTAPDGSSIAMIYDANGNLTQIMPPGRAAHVYDFGAFDLVERYLPPGLASPISDATLFTYDTDKAISSMIRPDGSRIEFQYLTASGLLSSVETPKGRYTNTYAANSDLLQSQTTPDSTTLTYSYAGDYVTQVATTGAVSSIIGYGYQADGNIANITAQGRDGQASVTSLDYDKDGLLVRAGAESLTRNNVGAISATALGMISQSLGFNSFGEIVSDKYSANATLLEVKYARDSLGRIISVKSQGPNREHASSFESFEYDRQSRLVRVVDSRASTREYRYDLNGNRISKQGAGATISATYDEQDRLLRYGRAEYKYNANGELVQKIERALPDAIPEQARIPVDELTAAATSYTYDSFGNLKSVTLPNHRVIEYILDGAHRRIGKKIDGKFVQGFVYQSQTQIAAELDATGSIVRHFVYASKANIPDYMVMGGKTYRIISDHVGSPRVLVDISSGRVIEELEFDEFGIAGQQLSRLGLPFGFAGGLVDPDTRLVHFGARDYDPETGRWLSKDPILFGGGDTNLYGYVLQDPVNFVDPAGLWAIQVGGSISTLLGPVIGVGGSGESGVAISYSNQHGLQIAGYQSAGVRAGAGLYGGVSLNFSLTPNAQRVGDLSGGGITTGVDTPLVGYSHTKSAAGGDCSASEMDTHTIGFGPGVIGDAYRGGTSTWMGQPLTFGGGH